MIFELSYAFPKPLKEDNLSLSAYVRRTYVNRRHHRRHSTNNS